MGRILVVDDSWVVRHHVQKYLLEADHEILMAESGEQCLETLARESVDLVFLDLLMPGKSGIDVLTELKGRQDAPPVVVLTADIQESTKQKVFALGAVAFLAKPPTADQVREAAREFGAQDAG